MKVPSCISVHCLMVILRWCSLCMGFPVVAASFQHYGPVGVGKSPEVTIVRNSGVIGLQRYYGAIEHGNVSLKLDMKRPPMRWTARQMEGIFIANPVSSMATIELAVVAASNPNRPVDGVNTIGMLLTSAKADTEAGYPGVGWRLAVELPNDFHLLYIHPCVDLMGERGEERHCIYLFLEQSRESRDCLLF
eukprot:Gb_21542 [translate_table: standard]